jgi:hypothetical protein
MTILRASLNIVSLTIGQHPVERRTTEPITGLFYTFYVEKIPYLTASPANSTIMTQLFNSRSRKHMHNHSGHDEKDLVVVDDRMCGINPGY